MLRPPLSQALVPGNVGETRFQGLRRGGAAVSCRSETRDLVHSVVEELLKLEQITNGARVRRLAVHGIATVKSVEFHGSNADGPQSRRPS